MEAKEAPSMLSLTCVMPSVAQNRDRYHWGLGSLRGLELGVGGKFGLLFLEILSKNFFEFFRSLSNPSPELGIPAFFLCFGSSFVASKIQFPVPCYPSYALGFRPQI